MVKQKLLDGARDRLRKKHPSYQAGRSRFNPKAVMITEMESPEKTGCKNNRDFDGDIDPRNYFL
jgi:hypothetical protein